MAHYQWTLIIHNNSRLALEIYGLELTSSDTFADTHNFKRCESRYFKQKNRKEPNKVHLPYANYCFAWSLWMVNVHNLLSMQASVNSSP